MIDVFKIINVVCATRNTMAERSQTKRGEKTKREKREQDMRRQIRKLESQMKESRQIVFVRLQKVTNNEMVEREKKTEQLLKIKEFLKK